MGEFPVPRSSCSPLAIVRLKKMEILPRSAVKEMRFAKKKQISVAIISFSIVILFSIRTALSEEIMLASRTNTSPLEEIVPHKVTPAEQIPIERQQSIETTIVRDTNDGMDAVNLTLKTLTFVPFEILTLDAYGLFAKYFDDVEG